VSKCPVADEITSGLSTTKAYDDFNGETWFTTGLQAECQLGTCAALNGLLARSEQAALEHYASDREDYPIVS
jgi:hypothetical protein